MNKRSFWYIATIAFLNLASIGARAGITTLVSVDSAGNQGNNQSYSSAISADGRYVAFISEASDLVAGDTNGSPDIFVRDRLSGTTTRVSVNSAGGQSETIDYPLSNPTMSADGRYVAFSSYASNLVVGDTNSLRDVFVHDRQTGVTTRVSVDSGGGQAVGSGSDRPAISADGRYVAFGSGASNLVVDDTNGAYDIFVHDRQTGATTLVSVDSAGGQGNYISDFPAISADGRYVAFGSGASDLVADDTNSVADIFVHDRQTGVTSRVSVDSQGNQGDRDSFYFPAVSADGRFVTFASESSNLVAGDTNGVFDTFVHDRVSGATTRVSLDSTGRQVADGSFIYSSISADGRYVAFESNASNLVTGDTNCVTDIFVHDRQTGTTTRVSVNNAGDQGKDDSYYPAISADGRFVTFSSQAWNFVASDVNNFFTDVFVHDRIGVLLEGPAGVYNCSDRIDNDNDGLIDTADQDCAPIPRPIQCNGLRATLKGTSGDDNLTGTSDSDVIVGFDGNDVINGLGGNDSICGGNGNDVINGGNGKDVLRGDNGDDTLSGNNWDDKLFGGLGNDTLVGGEGKDYLDGGANNDKLKGGAGFDSCNGQGGVDTHLGGCEIRRNIP